jgi:hypothetical protein
MFDALRTQGKPVIVIAETTNGMTFVCNTVIGIYDHGIFKRLLPDGWTCGMGEAAAAIYDALDRECMGKTTAPVGFYTDMPFREVNNLANYAIKALTEQLEGIAK